MIMTGKVRKGRYGNTLLRQMWSFDNIRNEIGVKCRCRIIVPGDPRKDFLQRDWYWALYDIMAVGEASFKEELAHAAQHQTVGRCFFSSIDFPEYDYLLTAVVYENPHDLMTLKLSAPKL